MDAVFVFGDKVACDREGHYYTGTSFSQEIFDRYLEHFDSLILMMRKAPVDPEDQETLSGMNLIRDRRVRVIFLPDTLASAKDFISLRSRRNIKKILEDQIIKGRAVILRTHSYYSYVAAGICQKRKISYLAEAVGCPRDSLSHHSIKGKVLAPFAAAQMRYVMKHASFALYVTKHFLQGRYPSEGICACISDAELLPLQEEVLEARTEKIRKLHDEPLRRLRIGTSGNVQVPYKGHRFVFRAIAELKKQGVSCFEYHLAGDGDGTALRHLAEELGIEDQIIFEGMLPHEKIYAWLDDLDLYIQPSETEGLSRALLEAMSRALPVLASDVGGNPELVDPSCLHKCGDVRQIGRQLAGMTPGRMLAMAEESFKRAGAYEKDALERRRHAFLARYADAAAASREQEERGK